MQIIGELSKELTNVLLDMRPKISPEQRFCSSCGSSQTAGRAKLSAGAATASAYSLTSPADQPYLQVGGGILFFCVVHVVFGSLRLFAHFSAIPASTHWLDRLLTMFGIVVGILLVTRAEYALDVLKIYLFTAFLFNSIVLFQSFWAPETSLVDRNTGQAVRQIMLAIIWFLYFRASVRVKATYGRNL